MKIVFTANGRCASAAVEPAGQPITAGSRGVPAEIHLSPDYDGLVVTAFFRSEYGAWPVVLGETPGTVTIPWEAMEKKSLTFDVGVVGKNGDGTIVIPTIWARAGKIVPATEDSGLEPGDPSADIGAQIVEQARAAAKKAEDAAAAAEEAIGYMPKIVDGTWWVYDAEAETWTDTGIQAEGQDGVGISGAVLNADYTLTITFTDGSSYTTPPIRGAQGDPGQIGPTPDISIGTVTTGAAGSQAAATMTGTPEAPVLNLTIPRGDPGEVTQAEFDELAEEVSDQKSAIDDIYPTATVTERSVKIPSALDQNVVTLTKDAGYEDSYANSFLEVYNHSLLAGVKWFPDTTIGSGGGTSSLSNRWTTDYVDIHTLSSVTLRLLYNWGSSYRTRVWTYGADLTPKRELLSSAKSYRNDINSFSLNDGDYYLRFCIPSYQEPHSYIGNCIELVESTDAHRYALDLGEFYGGEIDFVNGIVVPKYDSTGAEIASPVPYEIDPIVPVVSDNTGIYMTRTSYYYNIPGDFAVSYKMGVQEYIDQQTKATRSLIAGIETDMTASKAYSTGDMLIVGDTLYKATTAIASGATLTPGTNVNATTVAEQLILLANA